MKARFFFILLSIFLKRWEKKDVKMLREELKRFFSSFENIFTFLYFTVFVLTMYLFSLFVFVTCRFDKNCWLDHSMLYSYTLFLFSLPMDLLLVSPFVRNFGANIANFVWGAFLENDV